MDTEGNKYNTNQNFQRGALNALRQWIKGDTPFARELRSHRARMGRIGAAHAGDDPQRWPSMDAEDARHNKATREIHLGSMGDAIAALEAVRKCMDEETLDSAALAYRRHLLNSTRIFLLNVREFGDAALDEIYPMPPRAASLMAEQLRRIQEENAQQPPGTDTTTQRVVRLLKDIPKDVAEHSLDMLSLSVVISHAFRALSDLARDDLDRATIARRLRCYLEEMSPHEATGSAADFELSRLWHAYTDARDALDALSGPAEEEAAPFRDALNKARQAFLKANAYTPAGIALKLQYVQSVIADDHNAISEAYGDIREALAAASDTAEILTGPASRSPADALSTSVIPSLGLTFRQAADKVRELLDLSNPKDGPQPSDDAKIAYCRECCRIDSAILSTPAATIGDVLAKVERLGCPQLGASESGAGQEEFALLMRDLAGIAATTMPRYAPLPESADEASVMDDLVRMEGEKLNRLLLKVIAAAEDAVQAQNNTAPRQTTRPLPQTFADLDPDEERLVTRFRQLPEDAAKRVLGFATRLAALSTAERALADFLLTEGLEHYEAYAQSKEGRRILSWRLKELGRPPLPEPTAFSDTVAAFDAEAPTAVEGHQDAKPTALPDEPTAAMVEAATKAANITEHEFRTGYAAAVAAFKLGEAA